MDMRVELEQEPDGRWLAEVMELPGVMAYGQSREEALKAAEVLALRVLADRLEHGEPTPSPSTFRLSRREPVALHPSPQVLAALLRIGWTVERQAGTSHRVLERPGWPDFVFAFHDRVEIGPRMLARIAKRTGLLVTLRLYHSDLPLACYSRR